MSEMNINEKAEFYAFAANLEIIAKKSGFDVDITTWEWDGEISAKFSMKKFRTRIDEEKKKDIEPIQEA